MQHPDKDVLIAYANDTTIKVQFWFEPDGEWVDAPSSSFNMIYKWRIKPEPVTVYLFLVNFSTGFESISHICKENAESSRSEYIKANCECTPIKEVVFD